MCTGRIDLKHILRALSDGADGLLIVGCRLGECNYTTQGNYSALNKINLSRKIMEHVGLNPERLTIEFMSSGEGILFAKVVNDFARRVTALGPLGSSEGLGSTEIKAGLNAATQLVPYVKIALKDKLAARPPKPEDYASLYGSDEIASLLSYPPVYDIDRDKCRACMICLRRCPTGAIIGGKGQKHAIDQEKCIRCGTCFEVCPPRFGAVLKSPESSQRHKSSRIQRA